MKALTIRTVLSLAFASLLAACASHTGHRTETLELILQAAERPNGVPAQVTFTVFGSGEGRGLEGGQWFLNSETDYRDFRSLNVIVMPSVVSALRDAHGITTAEEMVGLTVRVQGAAQRRRIDLVCSGTRTNAYYFQTHLPVTRLEQIEIL